MGQSRVAIGKILKPFGVRGEVRVASLTDVPGRFEGLENAVLVRTTGESVDTKIRSVRTHGEDYIVGFSIFSTPEEASQFRGAFLEIPEEKGLPRHQDTFYQFELIGLQVEDQEGRSLGKVADILEYPQQQIMVISRNGDELLLPARKQLIEFIDIPNNKLRVTSKAQWDLSNAL